MVFISAQPDSDFFVWQLKVQISNLIKVGFDGKYHILVGYVGSINKEFIKLSAVFHHTQFSFFFYEDTRLDRCYIPSIVPHLLEKHFAANSVDRFFHIDSDVIFRELPDFELMRSGNYFSDTAGYIGAEYINSKDATEKLLSEMCSVVGISPALVKANQNHSGGAQYLLNAFPIGFWSKVERDSVALYKMLIAFNQQKNSDIQVWTAGMWSFLWNIWVVADCRVHDELSFCWATCSIDKWYKYKIYHNAGVTENDRDTLFYKGGFEDRNPFGSDLGFVDQNRGSAMYAREIENCLFK